MCSIATRNGLKAQAVEQCTLWLENCMHYELNAPLDPGYSRLKSEITARRMALSIERVAPPELPGFERLILTLSGDPLRLPMQIERIVPEK